MKDKMIFSTIHGSKLYGLDHGESDTDLYEVYEGASTTLTHRKDEDLDIVSGSLTAFLLRAYSGSHQSCEALFSPVKEWQPGMEAKWGAMIANVVIAGGDVYEKYERTIRNFCYGTHKERRHAVRLSYNLQELRQVGRFNPVLDWGQAMFADAMAGYYRDDELAHILGVFKEVV